MNNTAMPTQAGAVTEYNNSIFFDQKLELQQQLASQAQVQTQALGTLNQYYTQCGEATQPDQSATPYPGSTVYNTHISNFNVGN